MNLTVMILLFTIISLIIIANSYFYVKDKSGYANKKWRLS